MLSQWYGVMLADREGIGQSEKSIVCGVGVLDFHPCHTLLPFYSSTLA